MRSSHHHTTRRLVACVLGVAGIGTVVVVYALGSAGPTGSETVPLDGTGTAFVGSGHLAPASTSPGGSGRFSISGSVAGLYPGASLPLALTVSNPEPFTLVVTSITTSVGSHAAACPASDANVTSFAGALAVPAHAEAQVVVTATLLHVAPDACQGATFAFSYSGLATKR